MAKKALDEIQQLQHQFRSLGNKHRAQQQQRFFKTAAGEYADGDVFLGIIVPEIRKVAKTKQHLSLAQLKVLLTSVYHEERFLALIVLTLQYAAVPLMQQNKIYDFYLKYKKHINNWDLVDVSAHKIVGQHLLAHRKRPILYTLADSNILWDRRIAVLATFAFIKNRQFDDTIQLAERLLADPEDLMHKAVGWMLREVGKLDPEREEQFLQAHYQQMPRTMLRYAIEKFSPQRRRQYLSGVV